MSNSSNKLKQLLVDLEDQSWVVWERAWDDARLADVAAGRRYDKRIYAEKASEARKAFLARGQNTSTNTQMKGFGDK